MCMLEITIRQQPEIFNEIATRWYSITGGKLLLVSPAGTVIAHSNGTLNGGVSGELLRGVDLTAIDTTTSLMSGGPYPYLAVSLVQDRETIGYLIAPDSNAQQIPLLNWVAEIFVSRLVDLYALQSMTDELIGAWEQLELIYRVTENLTLASELRIMLQSMLQEIQKVTQTQESFIVLSRADYWLCVTGTGKDKDVFCNQQLLDQLHQINRVVSCNRTEECRKFFPELPATVQSLLATPLLLTEEGRAAIGLINKSEQDFTTGDIKLLAALAQQITTIINNHLTHQQLLNKERLSRELEIAAEIQESFLPKDLPYVGGLSMAVSSVPASEVGGDFFDFITVDDRHLALVVGDVSGKGIPAAMLTSVTRTMLRVEALRGEPPHKIIEQANQVLYQDLSRADAFVTVFVALVDTYEGTLSYASAGHTPTMLWRAENHKVDLLKATSFPVGVFENPKHETKSVRLYPGDTLVLYTDGITEAQSTRNELFGMERLVHIVERRASDSPEQLQQYIQSQIANFCLNAAWKDDATLLIVKSLAIGGTANPPYSATAVKPIAFFYPADMDHLTNISQEIAGVCRGLSDLPAGSRGDDFIYLIELAISEICTNIVKHAYAEIDGDIQGQVTLLSNGVQLDFFDNGAGFDPNSVPEPVADPNNLKEGGYGLHIVRQIMDVVSYTSDPGQGNHWHLIKFLPKK
jgi:serine phosphatase RsbU (regulator of sigma subunit)/anti-sigma regulatory factor (Ser/Thr protein kinase)